ncbi:hypothetical protein Cfor_11927 [Coptotermes formosanus]|uniref:Odorant receptor n=1 Tax=Coptotermes formosanus TaxID=36987 RepID=A0A6L2PJQ1_COPFO|nr:hypothetical protein Cfor_11927 [Coptotermes formosanus]
MHGLHNMTSNTRFQVQELTMRLRGGVLSSGLRWSKEQDEIARNTNRQARLLSTMYYAVAVSSVTGLVAISLRTSYNCMCDAKSESLNFLQELPLKAWFPVDMQQTRNYLLIFGFQLVIVIVGPMVNIGTDTFITGLIIHACGEFRVLKKSLRLLKQRALQLQQEDNSFRSQPPPEFVSDLEDVFSFMMFFQFLSISMRICLIIFHITMSDDKGLVQVTYVQILCVSFLQGLPFCWYGSELTYQVTDTPARHRLVQCRPAVSYVAVPALRSPSNFRNSVLQCSRRNCCLAQSLNP